MNEMKTAFRRTAVYFLLLAVNIIPCTLIPDVFPVRNLSTVYLLILSFGLVLYYYHRVPPTGGLSSAMKAFAWMGLLMILLRGVKYSAFSEVGALARHTWYLYYLPTLLMPLFLFYVALFVSPGSSARLKAVRRAALALTAVLILLVLTNDLHRQAFDFQPGYVNWDGDYSRKWLFYAAAVWQYALYISAVVILVIQCRIVASKKNAWIILIPAAIGTVMLALLLTDRVPRINGIPIFEFPETVIFTSSAVLECCMELGLIPTNTDYRKFFRRFSICAQITDKKGTTVYSSPAARPLTEEQFSLADGSRIAEHTVLHRMSLPGGFGFWQDDMTGLDRLNGELAEAKEELAEEAELIALQSELREKSEKIRQRTLVYDTIAKRTLRQSQIISDLAKTARASTDPRLREDCRRRIVLFGAYIKRYANLTLLSEQSGDIGTGEFGLSFSEVLRYLNFCGIPGEYIGFTESSFSTSPTSLASLDSPASSASPDSPASPVLPAKAALAVFEAFGLLLEINCRELLGVFVNLSSQSPGEVKIKVTAENMTRPIPEDMMKRLSEAGVQCETQNEDGVSYLCFTVLGGGEAQ